MEKDARSPHVSDLTGTVATIQTHEIFDEHLEVGADERNDGTTLQHDKERFGLLEGDPAITRLQLQHTKWQLTLPDRLVLAPIPSHESGRVKDVIDIGCGTGAWALDFASIYPSANILGVDLKPLQPTSNPLNVHFRVANVMDPEAWHDTAGTIQEYDLIHSRSISSGVSSWPALISLSWQHLRSGGWVELQEFHLPMRCDDESMAGTQFKKWNELLIEASGKVGVKVDGGFAAVPSLLENAGAVEIGRKGLKWPIGPWPKDKRMKKVGSMFRADLSIMLEGLSIGLFTKALGMERDAVTDLWSRVEAEMATLKSHAYVPIAIVWAKKP